MVVTAKLNVIFNIALMGMLPKRIAIIKGVKNIIILLGHARLASENPYTEQKIEPAMCSYPY
jgi:hypothetical protein